MLATSKSATTAARTIRPRLLTIKDTESTLAVSHSTVVRLIRKGKLRTVTLSTRAVRVLAEDVEKLLG